MKLFNRKQLENIKLSSKDDTRQTLTGLFFTGNSTVSTDGHRLMKVTANYTEENKNHLADWPANGVNWNPSQDSFILARSTVEKAIKNIPKSGHPQLDYVAIGLTTTPPGESKKAVCQTTDLDSVNNLETRTIEGKFPDYERCLPDYENLEHEHLSLEVNPNPSPKYIRVGISAKYLKEICAQLEKYQDKSHMIALYIKDEISPICITAQDDEKTEALAVVMPMKL